MKTDADYQTEVEEFLEGWAELKKDVREVFADIPLLFHAGMFLLVVLWIVLAGAGR